MNLSVRNMTSTADEPDRSTGTQSSRRPLLPPCRICGGKASGYHYGVNSCEACKGFFRRSLSLNGKYTCTRGNACTILPGRRNNCQACRMRKCKEIGMSKSAIRTGRYSYEVQTKNIEEVKSLKSQDNSCHGMLSSQSMTSHRSSDLNAPQYNVAQNRYRGSSIHSCSDHVNRSHEESTAAACYQPDVQSSHISGSTEKNVNSVTCNSLKQNGRNDNKSVNTVYTDEENESVLHNLLSAQEGLLEDLDIFLDEIKVERNKQEYLKSKAEMPDSTAVHREQGDTLSAAERDRRERMQQVAEVIDSDLRNMVTFIRQIPGWKSIHIEDKISLIRESAVEVWLVGHFQCLDADTGVFTGEFNTTKNESRDIYSDEYLACLYETANLFRKLKLKKEEVVVLKTIILTFTDRCELVNKEAVERVQLRMLDVFRYVCISLGTDFNKRFSLIIDKLTSARDLTEKFKAIAASVVSYWEILEKYPLVKEFFCGYK